ncbi:MAG: hypothetical protein M3Q03_18645, partial [Chloroflexota bacterium]|nr:hypothetical protein [Chloroflexota bacterium]
TRSVIFNPRLLLGERVPPHPLWGHYRRKTESAGIRRRDRGGGRWRSPRRWDVAGPRAGYEK